MDDVKVLNKEDIINKINEFDEEDKDEISYVKPENGFAFS